MATSSSPSTARTSRCRAILPEYSPEGRSEQYVVYVVLDAMVATAFDALSATELALEGFQVLAGETGNTRIRAGTLRAINVRLTRIHRGDLPRDGPTPKARTAVNGWLWFVDGAYHGATTGITARGERCTARTKASKARSY